MHLPPISAPPISAQLRRKVAQLTVNEMVALLGNFNLVQINKELVERVIEIHTVAKGQAQREALLRTPHLSVQDQRRFCPGCNEGRNAQSFGL